MLNRLTGISMKGHELLGAILFVFYLYGVIVSSNQFTLWLAGLFDKKIKIRQLAIKLHKAVIKEYKEADEVVTISSDDFTIVVTSEESKK